MAKESKKKVPSPKAYNLKAAQGVQPPVQPIFFNRFAIEESDGFIVLFLGSVVAGELLSSRAIAINHKDVAQVYESGKDYIGGLSSVSLEPSKPWDRPRTRLEIEVANVVSLSNTGDVGEIIFANVKIHDLAMVKQGVLTELVSYQILLARSSIEVHKQVVGHLFKGLASNVKDE